MAKENEAKTVEKVEGCVKPVMGNWKSKRFAKKTKGSRTPGKSKNENCQSTSLDRWMAKKSRSYKDPLYSAWNKKKTGM